MGIWRIGAKRINIGVVSYPNTHTYGHRCKRVYIYTLAAFWFTVCIWHWHVKFCVSPVLFDTHHMKFDDDDLHSHIRTDMHTSVQRHAEHIDTRYYYMSYGLKWFEVVSQRKDEWVNQWASELDRAEAERTFCTALYRITCALCVYNGTSEMHIILFSQRFSIVSSMYCLSIITNK